MKNNIIPNAVNWFTGDADDSDFNPDEFDDEDEDDDFDDDEEDGNSDEDDGDSNYVNPFAPSNQGKAAPGGPGGEGQQECKTQ